MSDPSYDTEDLPIDPVDRADPGPPFEPPPPMGPAPRGRLFWPLVAAFAVVAVAVVVYFIWFRGGPEAPVTAAAPAPSNEVSKPEPPTTDPVPEWVLPELDASDSALRVLVRQVSSHPRLVSWLANDDLVRRFTAGVTNVAEGASPRTHVQFMAPAEEFSEIRRGERVLPDPAGYERYRTLVEVLESVDAQGAAESFERMEPLLQEAYRELGYPDGDFRRALLAALRELLATPRLSSPPELEPKLESFEFADPDLESLSPAQKHLLRLGPEYAVRVQGKLYELGIALGFTPAELG